MLVNLSASSRNSVSVAGYALISENQITVNMLVLQLAIPASVLQTLTLQLANRSTGGQNIRIGFYPAFAPAAGILLTPGDTCEICNVTFAISAIASANGALLDAFITAQQMG